MERHKICYREGNGVFPQKVVGRVKLVLEVVLIKFTTPLPFNLH
jgi:hypothetical protein